MQIDVFSVTTAGACVRYVSVPTSPYELRTKVHCPRNPEPVLDGTTDLHFVYTGDMATPDTTTVRVSRPDSERLRSLARARHAPVIDVLHAAIDALERQEFLRGLNDDYRLLREDPERWEQYVAERQEWDSLA